MAHYVDVLRDRAAEFRQLAITPCNSADLRKRLLELAQRCDRIADEIERRLGVGRVP